MRDCAGLCAQICLVNKNVFVGFFRRIQEVYSKCKKYVRKTQFPLHNFSFGMKRRKNFVIEKSMPKEIVL